MNMLTFIVNKLTHFSRENINLNSQQKIDKRNKVGDDRFVGIKIIITNSFAGS